MFEWLIASPAAMPFDVPIGCPYCSTKSPFGIARVAKRWPGVTSPVIASVRAVEERYGVARGEPGLHDGDVVLGGHDDGALRERAKGRRDGRHADARS